MPNEDVRFGLIGYGLFGTHHAQAIAAAPATRLVAVAVKSQKSQQAARNAHPDADVVGDYRQLLDREDIDIVSVVVPNLMHFEVARAALQAGKHVLLEKPMALGTAECDELVRLAEGQQRILAVGHELRLSSLWGRVRELIDQGTIGHPQYALIELSRFPYRQGAEGWRWDIDRVGSWILEEPIHFFDLARWYLEPCGEPQSVYARANSRHPDRPELKDNFSAMVNFRDGAWAVVSQSLAAFGHHQTAKIAGTEGAVWAWWSAADARSDQSQFGLRYGLGDQVHEESFEKPAGELLELADEVRAVADCVRSGGTPPCTGDDGRWSVRMCLAAEQSVREGQLVTIEDFLRAQSTTPRSV
jgi:myo-inositol 2-dehydrogenase/D-chiro-inositol 1-dehydrogenase